MSRRAITVGVVTAVVLLGGGGAYLAMRPRPVSPVAAASSSHSVPPPAAPQPKLGCRFVVGEEAGFVLSSVVSIRGANDPNREERFEAVLRIRTIEVPRTEEWLFGAALVEAHLKQGLSSPDERITDPLDTPFLFRMNRECRFTGIGFPHAWKGPSRRFVSSTLRGTEMVAIGDRRAHTYTASQTDGLGTYSAVYDLSAPSLLGIPVLRRKTSYLAGPSHSPVGTRVDITLSDTKGVFDPQGAWLRQLDAHESVRLSSQGQVLADLEGVSQLARDDSKGELSWPPADFSLANYDWEDPFQEVAPTNDKPVDPRIAALSFEQALAELARLYDGNGKPDSYRAALFLSEWLRAHPKMADSVLSAIRARTLPDGQRASAFLALERCGTPEARAALESGIRDRRLASLDRARAASALSDVPKPDRDTYKALLAEARLPAGGSDADSRMVTATSLRAFGHLGGRTGLEDDTIKTGVRAELSQMLDSKADGRQVDVLDAIGNTGDESLAAQLTAKLSSDQSAIIREHAARAFRLMDPDAARQPLEAALATETDPTVRAAITDTLAQVIGGGKQASPLDVTSAVAALSTETDPTARAALINLLGPAAATSPIAKQALLADFRQETVTSLQRLIGKYLSVEDLR